MAKKKAVVKESTNEETTQSGTPHYQEWEVKVTKGEPEKIKIVRPVVKISEEEAGILNKGVLQGGNTYAKMYFLPE